MSKKNGISFMMLVESDEKLKAKFESSMGKHEGKSLSPDEWVNIVKEELIPFAKELGYEFNLEDINELEKPANATLSDEELDEIVGGMGRFTRTLSKIDRWTYKTVTYSCEHCPDDNTLVLYFEHGPNNHCPNWSPLWETYPPMPWCNNCAHLGSKDGTVRDNFNL